MTRARAATTVAVLLVPAIAEYVYPLCLFLIPPIIKYGLRKLQK